MSSSSLVSYQKPWAGRADQLRKLEAKGLAIDDFATAENFLRHVNYYRFVGYGLAFLDPAGRYRAETTFDQVKAAHDFDAALRDLLMEALEIAEIDLRASTAHVFGRIHGPLGYMEASKFHQRFNFRESHRDWLDTLHEEVRRSREIFVQHFRAKYREYPNLPLWAATEVMSFGTLSRMIAGMHKADRRAISSEYGFSPEVLFRLPHHLGYVRNLCAHHARLWDREWTTIPSLPDHAHWRKPWVLSNRRLHATLLLLRRLLQRPSQRLADAWRDRVTALLRQPPAAVNPLLRMGLASDWELHPLWAKK